MNLLKEKDFVVFFLAPFVVLILTDFVHSQDEKSFEISQLNLQGSIQTVLSDFGGQGRLKKIDDSQRDKKSPPIKRKKKLSRKNRIRKKCRKLLKSLSGSKNITGRKIW